MNPHIKERKPSKISVFLGVVLATVVMAASPLYAAEQTWPDRPIRLVVPYAPGQGADLLARLLSSELSVSLGQPIIVENRAGAGGNIGASVVARSAPDGYTFMLGTNATNAANEFLYGNAGFDAATDFTGVAMIGLLPMVIATSAPDLPANGIAGLIDRARAQPNVLNVGLPSTTSQVVFAQFVQLAQAPLFAVRYKASAQSMADVLGGQIPLVIDTVTAARPFITSGKLRALGITSLKASDMLPGIRSVSEQGVAGFDVVAWDAVFAPRNTPLEIIKTMSEHIERVLQEPQSRRKMLELGVDPLVMGPAQLNTFVNSERRKWGDIIKTAGIRVE